MVSFVVREKRKKLLIFLSYRGVEKQYPAVSWTHNLIVYTVYILKSKLIEKYYIGSTNNFEVRIRQHNGKKAGWTKRYQPWMVVYTELTATRAQAMRIEKYLKSLKNKKRIIEYIAGWRSSTS